MEILAIGGGDKTPAIKEALSRTGINKPRVLLVPSACSTEVSYNRKVSSLDEYFKNLGTEVTTLHEYGEKPSDTRIAHELGSASLIYTIGGNSPYMLRTMRTHGTDNAVRRAIEQGKIHAGTSAGALLPFELMHSCVAARPLEQEWDYDILNGIGVLPGVATAHANQHDPTPSGVRPDNRRDALMTNFPAVTYGYGIDNGAALLFSSSSPEIIISTPGASAHFIEKRGDSLSLRPIDPSDLKV